MVLWDSPIYTKFTERLQRIEDEKASGTINVDQTEIYEDFTYYLDATKKLKDE
jgi:uncharacterized protein (UPF0335 family)